MLAPGGLPDGPHSLIVEIQVPSNASGDAPLKSIEADLKAAIHLELSYSPRRPRTAPSSQIHHVLDLEELRIV